MRLLKNIVSYMNMQLKKMIKKSYIYFIKISKKIYWNMQVLFYKNKIKIDNSNLDLNGKILIIVPHADDELIGCYSIIKKHTDKVQLLYVGYTGHNNNIDNYNIRKNEFCEFCKINNVKYQIIKDISNMKEEMKILISNLNPNYIFIPSMMDWHNEHIIISELLDSMNQVIDNNSKIVLYKISQFLPLKTINMALKMTKKEQKLKWDMFKKTYKSQNSIPYDRFIAEEQIIGKEFNFYACESFSMYSKKEWLDYYELNIGMISKYRILLKYINNLKKKNRMINKYYNELKEINKNEVK